MAKPQGKTITELAAITPSTRVALYKNVSRAGKKKGSLIYIKGYGWCSITKPGKEYIVYLISPDAVSKSEMKKEIESNISELLDLLESLLCEECLVSVSELRSKLLG
jgi:hypothetical protein